MHKPGEEKYRQAICLGKAMPKIITKMDGYHAAIETIDQRC